MIKVYLNQWNDCVTANWNFHHVLLIDATLVLLMPWQLLVALVTVVP